MKKSKAKLATNKKPAVKDAGNNQWTNANLKYYPDKREPKNGPSGE